METLNILLNGNRNCEAIFPTVIKSVCDHTSRKVHARIICDGWRRPNFETEKLKVEFVEYSSGPPARLPKYRTVNHRTLYLTEIADWDRCLMICWDQLVMEDVDELYDTEFEGIEVMTATPSRRNIEDLNWGGVTLKNVIPESEWGLKSFPMGANVIDIQKCKKLGILSKAQDYFSLLKGEDHMTSVALFAKHIKRVDPKWNVLLNGQRKEPRGAILHYNGGAKPWNTDKGAEWQIRHVMWDEIDGSMFFEQQEIIFMMSAPRSGSTLAMRLFNSCKNIHGKNVAMNGETGCFDMLMSLKSTFIRCAGRTVGIARLNGPKQFPSHYFGGKRGLANNQVAQTMRSLCGASKGETVGFKEVNYGVKGSEYPQRIVDFLRGVSKNTHIILLERDAAEVSASMKRRPGWWDKSRCTEEAVTNQLANLKNVNYDLILNYNDLLTYESFLGKIQTIGLRIAEEDYKKVIRIKQ